MFIFFFTMMKWPLFGQNGITHRIWAPSTNQIIRMSFFAGGDDVHQLCEAGEEEFLEIMALVGMASKPLHVRRLQKALQEWVQNPGKQGLTCKNAVFYIAKNA